MHDEPRTWHYGVVARWWAEFNVSGPEIAYFQKFIEDDGEPALDVACGAGRLLIPYLQAGLDIDGFDVSPDMLALCRERATREGLSPNLYAQAMHELDLPRRYRTIVVCGGFGLGGTRDQDFAALRRLYDHLEPGGLLLLDNENPYNDARLWRYCLKEERTGLPEPLRDPGRRRVGSDGAEYELRSRVIEVDPLAQSVAMEMHADMWRDGEHVASDEHVLRMNLYFKNELLLMLERTGFADVAVQADYKDAAPDVESEFLVFIAKKADGHS